MKLTTVTSCNYYINLDSSSPYPTSVSAITDQQIFGFDVGSRTANIFTLVVLIGAIIWLGLSIAYCITRKEVSEMKLKARNNKQKFEDYWGDVGDSIHSTTGLNESTHSDTALNSGIDSSSTGLNAELDSSHDGYPDDRHRGV